MKCEKIIYQIKRGVQTMTMIDSHSNALVLAKALVPVEMTRRLARSYQ